VSAAGQGCATQMGPNAPWPAGVPERLGAASSPGVRRAGWSRHTRHRGIA
jgi:hypothetical protein